MSDLFYQTSVANDIEKKFGQDKVTRFEGFEKNVIKIDDRYVVLIKYCASQSDPVFKFTDKEIGDLLLMQKQFPLNTFIILTNGDKMKCSFTFKELGEICNIKSIERSIYIEDITLKAFDIRGALGKIKFKKDRYLNF